MSAFRNWKEDSELLGAYSPDDTEPSPLEPLATDHEKSTAIADINRAIFLAVREMFGLPDKCTGFTLTCGVNKIPELTVGTYMYGTHAPGPPNLTEIRAVALKYTAVLRDRLAYLEACEKVSNADDIQQRQATTDANNVQRCETEAHANDHESVQEEGKAGADHHGTGCTQALDAS